MPRKASVTRTFNQQREPIRENVRENVRPNSKTEVVGRDGKVLSRKRGSNVDRFYIPPEVIPEGWSYEWKSETIMGEPQTSHMLHMAENGWRPVDAGTHPGMFMPADYVGPVRRDGMILMERPIELTLEAQEEDRRAANSLIQAQKEGLGLAMPRGFSDAHPAIRPRVKQSYERSDVARPALQIED